VSQTSGGPVMPAASSCPAPALLHCSWRHTQHGGQGDSVDISYQIFVLKAANRPSDTEGSMSVRTRGVNAIFSNAAESPALVLLQLYTGASLPASQRQLSFISSVAFVYETGLAWRGFIYADFKMHGVVYIRPWSIVKKITAKQWEHELHFHLSNKQTEDSIINDSHHCDNLTEFSSGCRCKQPKEPIPMAWRLFF